MWSVVHRRSAHGSPPRAWGQSGRRAPGRVRIRFTPTGVGTMVLPVVCFLLWSVHPHGRGDNWETAGRVYRASGSPPRAWGQSGQSWRDAAGARFTPTGVGTIMSITLSLRGLTVHPHGRGDNHPDPRTARAPTGSPPRAWGQSVNAPSISWYVRFTPTGVGTMLRRVGRCGSASVHPHGRGDNLGARMLGRIVNGSPPRAWGQCWHEHPYADDVRFTPTGVGTIGC